MSASFTPHLFDFQEVRNSICWHLLTSSRCRSRTSLDGYRLVSLLDDLSEDEGEKFTNCRCSTSVLEDPCVFEYDEIHELRVQEETPKKGSLFHRWFSFSAPKLRSNRRTHAEATVPLSSEKKNAHPKLGKWLTFRFWNVAVSIHAPPFGAASWEADDMIPYKLVED